MPGTYCPAEQVLDPGRSLRARWTRQSGAGRASPFESMVDMMVAKNEGLDNAEPRTPQSTTPTSFRQWCEEVLKPAVLS